ncbi:leucine-rich repeat domain-containing protein [Aporhodopirellula aestuarii]|uniref:leucine-rich repeat domain-containing protein n=1 Tax=Aporhodopirellula aestuarii TaxID=2950107 RepID=UPI0038993522
MVSSSHRAPMPASVEQSRRIARSLVVGLIFLLWLGWMTVPRTMSTSEAIWFMPTPTSGEFGNQLADPDSPMHRSYSFFSNVRNGWSVGGFPVDAYHVLQNRSVTRVSFHPLAMLVNLLAISVMLGGAVFFSYLDSPQRELLSVFRLRGGPRNRGAIVLIAATVLLSLVAAYHFRRCERLNRMAYHAREAGVVRSVNHPFMTHMPAWFQSAWTHVHRIEVYTSIWDPNAEQRPVDEASLDAMNLSLNDYPAIQSVGLIGELSPEIIADVTKLPLMQSVSVHRPKDLEQVQELLCQLPPLDSLEIQMSRPYRSRRHGGMRRGYDFDDGYGDRRDRDRWQREFYNPQAREIVNSDVVLDLSHLATLRILRLGYVPTSAVDLEAVSASSKSLQEFDWQVAGRIQKRFELRDLPTLQVLSLSSTEPDESLVTIDLRRMPQLHSLTLPREQKFDLSLVELPVLNSIESRSYSYMGDEDEIESLPTIQGLTIDNAPSLTSLDLVADNLKRWDVKRCPSLRTISITGLRPEYVWDPDVSDPFNPEEAPDANEKMDALWQWLAGEQGINTLYLSNLNLHDVDFSQFGKLKYLKAVWFSDCAVAVEQLELLAALPSMRELHAPQTPMTEKSVGRLLAANSNWEVLKVDWSELSKIEIRNQPHLRSALGNVELRANSIDLENLPRLRDHVFTSGGVQALSLQNVPQLQGLFVSGKIPGDSELSGLLALEHFCISGCKFSLGHLEALKKCSQLQTLCLPGCVVPAELFDELPRWRKLAALDLKLLRVATPSGPPVWLSDSHTAPLGAMRSLSRINLDRTEITGRSISILSNCKELQAISLRGCGLSEEDLTPLVGNRVLTELNVTSRTKVPELLESVVVRGSWVADPDDMSTFDMSWNSIFTGEPRPRERSRSLQRGTSGRRGGGGGAMSRRAPVPQSEPTQ